MPVIHTPLEDSQRSLAVSQLAMIHADICAYISVLNQLRWSLVGAGSNDLTAEIARVLPETRQAAEHLASRLSVLDAPPQWNNAGTAVTIPPAGWSEVDAGATALISAVSICVMRARDNHAALQQADIVSATIVVNALTLLEQQASRWQASTISWLPRGLHGS